MFSLRTFGFVVLAAIALLVLVPPPAMLTGPETPPADAETFARLETKLMAALRDQDRSALEALLADDYELTSTEVVGGRLGKVGYVQRALRSDFPPIDDFHFRSLTTTPLGNDLMMVKLDVDQGGGIAFDPEFFVDWPKSHRPHQIRLEGGDSSSDSYCFP